MPDNIERDIEKRLCEAAAQRRAAAGDPTLHPATRRMLQAEVRRRWGAPTGAGAAHWLKLFWPRIGVAAALLTLLALGSWGWLLPPKSEPQHLAKLDATSETASAFLNEAEPLQSLAAPAAMPASEKPASAPDERARRVAESISRGPVAPASAPASRSVGHSTEKLMATAPSGGRLEGQLAQASRDLQPVLTVSGNRNQAKGETSAIKSTGTQINANVQAFRNVAIAAEDKLKASKAPVVLNYFTVSQSGDQFTVVDEDGSVYHGTGAPVVPADEVGAKALGVNQTTTFAVTDSAALAKDAQKQKTVANENWTINAANAAAQNWAFKVEGTNRSLRQKVVFTGNLLQNGDANSTYNFANQANSNYYLNQQAKQASELNQAVQNTGSLQNNFINGRVTVGKQKEAEVNALAVEPQ